MNQRRWGIIGTGRIAKTFAKGVALSQTGKVIAVGSRNQEKADQFGGEFGLSRCYGTYEALLADPELEIVYISTPHPQHLEWILKAAEAGKHILCEKPLTLTWAEACVAIEKVREKKVFLMEAFMYRCHPQIAQALEIVKQGKLGEVRMLQASFGFSGEVNPESRLFKNELGGGGIMDVGCYPVSFAVMLAGFLQGKEGVEPLDVFGAGSIGTTGVDEHAAALLKFENGLIAELSTALRAPLENGVRIMGSEGTLFIPHPWIVTAKGGSIGIQFRKKGQSQFEEIAVPQVENIYAVEADCVVRHLQDGQAAFPLMNWAESLATMRTLDRWRKAVGVVYPSDEVQNQIHPAAGRPLARRSMSKKMSYMSFPGSAKKVSRLVIGSTIQNPQNHCYLYDAFYEAGGTAIDTAFLYGEINECAIGQWLKSRGVREEIFLIGKGAHTPLCDPLNLSRQLEVSLQRLKTHYLDLYLMHRDNPDIPAGEFIEVLNKHLKAGQVRAFGASNWSLERVDEANEYARKKGLSGFSTISCNFSLARMIKPVWSGAVSVSDPGSIDWLRKRGLPLFAWSSQARGFFAQRGDPRNLSDKEMVRCWHDPENFEKRRRASLLAEKKGVLPINIALAYVLQQTLPLYALVGPVQLSELRTTLGALEIELTPDEMRWLNLEIQMEPEGGRNDRIQESMVLG